MGLELGYKLTNILDDFAYVDLLIAKDRTGPVFVSKQTDIMFILTAHLKGYTRDQIKIDINEDGSKILISGEKPVQEMVMVGLKVYKKEIEMRGFRKAFKIPVGVILDKIKARFNEDEGMLTISMPKVIEGVKGVGIEEVKEEEIARGNSKSLQVEADEEIDRETFEHEESAESGGKDAQNIDKIPAKLSASAELDAKDAQNIENLPEKLPVSAELDGKDAQKVDQVSEKLSVSPDRNEYEKEVASKRKEMEIKEVADLKGEIENEVQEEEKVNEKPPVFGENMATDMQEQEASKWDQLVREKRQTDGAETQEEERSDDGKSTEIKKKFRDQSTQTDAPERPKKCCTPMIAGSALLVSLMVFVIHLIRDNDKPRKKKQ